MRRLALVVAVGLVAAPAQAAVAKPKAKPLPACVTFTDAASDSGPEGQTALDDPALDITKVRFSTTGDTLVAQVTVSKYAERPMLAPGNRFQASFTVDGKLVDIFWKTSPIRDYEGMVYIQQGVRVNQAVKHKEVTGSVSGNTVTMSVKLNMLKSAVGAKIEGLRATNVHATALGSYVANPVEWDIAHGPGTGFVLGQACR